MKQSIHILALLVALVAPRTQAVVIALDSDDTYTAAAAQNIASAIAGDNTATATLSSALDLGTAASGDIGTDVQPWSDNLDGWATKSVPSGSSIIATSTSGPWPSPSFLRFDGSVWFIATASDQRTALGLGTAAESDAGDFQAADSDLATLASAGNSGFLAAIDQDLDTTGTPSWVSATLTGTPADSDDAVLPRAEGDARYGLLTEQTRAIATRAPRGGVRLNGTSGTINAGDIFDQDMATNWSIAFWLQASGPSQMILRKGSNVPNYRFFTDASGKLAAVIQSAAGTATATTPSAITDGQWHHVVLSVNLRAADGFRLYVDGQLAASADPSSVGDLGTANGLYLGSNNGGAPFFAGALSEVALLNVALSPGDVATLFTDGVASWIAAHPEHSAGGIVLFDESLATWSPTALTVTTGQSDPAGGTGAYLFVEAAEALAHRIVSSDLIAANQYSARCRVFLKQYGSTPYAAIRLSSAAHANNVIYLDFANGTVVGDDLAYVESAHATDVGSGWWRVDIHAQALSGSVMVYSAIDTAGDSANLTPLVYPGNTGNGLYVYQPVVATMGAVAAPPLDEGVGYQFRDLTANRLDALASTTGVTHLLPRHDGYIRASGLDANGQAVYVLDGSRDILPANATITRTVATAAGASAIASGVLAVHRDDGSTGASIGTNGAAITAGQSLVIPPTVSQDLTDRRVKIPDGSDAGLDNFSIRIDYELN